MISSRMWNRLLPRFASAIWAIFKLALVAGAIALGSCSTTRTILQTAPDRLPKNHEETGRAPLPETNSRQLLQSELYGEVIAPYRVMPETFESFVLEDANATLFQWRVFAQYGTTYRRPLDIVLLMPDDHPNAPVILSQNFCPNNEVVPFDQVKTPDDQGFCSEMGPLTGIFTFFFGRHIVTPPLEEILSKGYGFAAIYPSQFIPDSRSDGTTVMDNLFTPDTDRPGALALWAGLTDMAAEIIEDEIGERPMIAFGHSRFGKTALLSAAWFDRVDAAIAHQSGTLGASRLTDDKGEPLSALVENYPHWPNRRAQTHADNPSALPVQPRDLLALISSKPVLLGNAKRDVWSDPFGAFIEASAAWPNTFDAKEPGNFRAESSHAFWQRPGTHGVTKEDWEAFLDWLDQRHWDENSARP